MSKLQDIAHLCPSPPIDTLIIVSDHADIVGWPDQLHQQVHLQTVGILKLIHGDVAVALPPVFTGLPLLPEHLLRQYEQIIKVERVASPQLPLIAHRHRSHQIIRNLPK